MRQARLPIAALNCLVTAEKKASSVDVMLHNVDPRPRVLLFPPPPQPSSPTITPSPLTRPRNPKSMLSSRRALSRAVQTQPLSLPRHATPTKLPWWVRSAHRGYADSAESSDTPTCTGSPLSGVLLKRFLTGFAGCSSATKASLQ